MNIQAVAKRTGVPAATLRKWEQRYGVLTPARTAGSHRRYSERDLLRVEWLKARLAEGYRIGEAARLLGTVNGGAPHSPRELVAELVRGARSADASRIEQALDQAFALKDLGAAVSEVIEPALREAGECWADGTLSIGREHQLSELVRGRLRALVDGRRTGTRGSAVLCCVPGERHEIGLLTLAALLQADGWATVYLGADTPLADAADVAAHAGAIVICVSATLAEHAAAASRQVAELASSGPTLLRGGQAYGGVPAAAAVAELRQAVAV